MIPGVMMKESNFEDNKLYEPEKVGSWSLKSRRKERSSRSTLLRKRSKRLDRTTNEIIQLCILTVPCFLLEINSDDILGTESCERP